MKWGAGPTAGALSAALLLSGLTGCAAPDADTGEVRVVAGFYPLAYAAQRVAGDRSRVGNLTTPGGEPHDLELGFRETVSVADADVVVYERGFQSAVDETVANVAEGVRVDAARVVALQQVDGEVDPHFWQDPLLLADVGDAVAAALSEADPAHAAAYQANADDLRADLVALDRAYATGLSGCARSTVVVSHDAFGYLRRYGLRFEAITGLSPDAEPTPANLARLQELVGEQGITTVFSERLASPRLAQSLADDLGVRTAVLDPLEGLSDATAGEDYLTLMYANLTALQEANGC